MMKNKIKKAYKLLNHPDHKQFFDFVRYDSIEKDFNSGMIILKEENEKLVGFCSLHLYKVKSKKYKCEKGDIRIKQIVILPKKKGTGFASIFFKEVENECKKRGAISLVLSVETNNLRAISFYKKMGMTSVNKGSWNRHGKQQQHIIFKKQIQNDTKNFIWNYI